MALNEADFNVNLEINEIDLDTHEGRHKLSKYIETWLCNHQASPDDRKRIELILKAMEVDRANDSMRKFFGFQDQLAKLQERMIEMATQMSAQQKQLAAIPEAQGGTGQS